MPASIRIEPSAEHHGNGVSVTPYDAYLTSGTSPTRTRPRYDTVHLLGVGAVGRAFLACLAGSRRTLVAVTDSTATLHDAAGLDPLAIIQWKEQGRALREFTGARSWPAAQALALADADIVVDASATDLTRTGWTAALSQSLARGACVALAAKAALCEAGAEWLSGDHARRVGCHAVLGGTGLRFTSELTDLRQRWRGVAIVGNASTTTILEAVERGATLADGIATAARLGFLETDPELDLRGHDAAVKLAIVAGVLTGRRIDPRTIPCEDIRTIDLRAVTERARRGYTTRLVARLHGDGRLSVGYEEVADDSVLAAKPAQVVYDYRLTRNERRLHIGSGIGPAATAGALWTDVQALVAHAAAPPRAALAAG